MQKTQRSTAELQMLQALPIEIKLAKTQLRIREWVNKYGLEGVYVSFSGGKDSTVLLDIARTLFPRIKAAYVDTGLEYPEIRDFVKTFENVDWLKPKMNFRKVIETYGYPFISKEVSECVYGARKYVKALDEQRNANTIPERESCRMLNSTGKQRGRENTPYRFEYNKLCGQGKYAPILSGGGTTISTVNYEELENIVETQKTPIRLKILLGKPERAIKRQRRVPLTKIGVNFRAKDINSF